MKKDFLTKAARVTKSIPFWLAGLAGANIYTVATTPALPKESLSLEAPVRNKAAADADYKRLYAEAVRIDQEYKSITFLDTSLAKAQENLGRDNKNLEEQIDILQRQQEKSQKRWRKVEEDRDAFHVSLATTFTISEKAASDIYFGPFKGEKYADYYREDFAHRDECRVSLGLSNAEGQAGRLMDCMEARNKAEGDMLWSWSDYARNVGSTGGVLFGLAGLTGAWNRRRAKKEKQKPFDDLEETKRMLRPQRRGQ